MKFMKKHEHAFETYKRNHAGSNFEEAEISKIRKEKNMIQNFERKAKNLASRDFSPAGDCDISVQIENAYHESKKAAGNKRAHKNRLRELQRNEDFV